MSKTVMEKLWQLLNTPLGINQWHQVNYRSFGGGGGTYSCNCWKGKDHE